MVAQQSQSRSRLTSHRHTSRRQCGNSEKRRKKYRGTRATRTKSGKIESRAVGRAGRWVGAGRRTYWQRAATRQAARRTIRIHTPFSPDAQNSGTDRPRGRAQAASVISPPCAMIDAILPGAARPVCPRGHRHPPARLPVTVAGKLISARNRGSGHFYDEERTTAEDSLRCVPRSDRWH